MCHSADRGRCASEGRLRVTCEQAQLGTPSDTHIPLKRYPKILPVWPHGGDRTGRALSGLPPRAFGDSVLIVSVHHSELGGSLSLSLVCRASQAGQDATRVVSEGCV